MRRRNGRFGWRLALVSLFLMTVGAPAQEDPEAQFLNELTEAYVTFGRANRAREAQAWDEALQLYEDALAQYQRLHNLYPERQAEIVQYRMADCANQVESLRRRPGRKKGKASRAAEEEPEPLWRERYQTLLKENQYLHERLVELEEQAIAPAAVETPEAAMPIRAAAPAAPVPDIVSRAVALEKKGELEPALALYRSAALQAPGRPDVVNGEARCLLKLGRSGEGVAILRPVVARGTGEPEARLLLGIGLCALRQYREAIEVLRAATPDDPRSAAALGVAWIGLGNLGEARTELEQAVALDPLMGDAHMNLALVLAAGTGADREAARRHYRRALKLGAAPESRIAESLGMR